MYNRYVKRALDFAVAVVGLLVASPLLAVCAMAIRLESKGAVFFRQRRVGQSCKLFQLVKLRTMVDNTEQMGWKVTASGDARVTRVGRWLRKTKIDEVPQLWNVLLGEMSLVGPRPEVPEYVAAYDSEQKRVLELKPGMTSAASLQFVDEEEILGRQTNTEDFYVRKIMAEKLALDLAYRERIGFFEDTRLVLRTVARVLRLARNRKES